jgi:6-phosphofructokinase 2
MAQIVTLTLSPAVDLSTSAPRLDPDHKLRCAEPRRDPGGGGVNVARVIHRLGAEVLAVYPAGGPTGQRLTALLEAEGAPTRVVPAVGDTRENFYVLETSTGRQFKFILPGPPLGPGEEAACIEALGLGASPPACLVCSGGLPPRAGPDVYARIARLAKAAGAKVAVDTHGPALAAALLEGVWLIKPSLHELQDLVGWELPDQSAQLAACRQIVKAGQAEQVALSLGDEGALLVSGAGAWRAFAPKVRSVSSVGAGDSFMAGLVMALIAGATPPQALRRAIAAGAAAVLTRGTGLGTPAEIDRLAAQVEVQPLLAAVPG